MKAFAKDEINVAQKLEYVLARIENIARKRETLVASIFFFSLQEVSPFPTKVLKHAFPKSHCKLVKVGNANSTSKKEVHKTSVSEKMLVIKETLQNIVISRMF